MSCASNASVSVSLRIGALAASAANTSWRGLDVLAVVGGHRDWSGLCTRAEAQFAEHIEAATADQSALEVAKQRPDASTRLCRLVLHALAAQVLQAQREQ